MHLTQISVPIFNKKLVEVKRFTFLYRELTHQPLICGGYITSGKFVADDYFQDYFIVGQNSKSSKNQIMLDKRYVLFHMFLFVN